MRGLMNPTTDTSVAIDLKALIQGGSLNITGLTNIELRQNLNWGIFLVDRSTGQVLKYLGSFHRISVE